MVRDFNCKRCGHTCIVPDDHKVVQCTCGSTDYSEARFNPTGIEASVIVDIAKRQQHGIQKYGATVDDNPLTRLQWLQHAYEEALDLAVYLKKCIKEEINAVPRN